MNSARNKFKKTAAFLMETYKEWQEDRVPRHAAALAYYTIFSLAPLLVVVIAIATFFLGSRTDVRNALILQIQSYIGQTGAQAVNSMIDQASRPAESIFATLIGIALLLLGASGLFGQLQESLNTIWEVKARSGGFLVAVKDRFLSFTMVLGIGFLLLVLLVISTLIAALSNSLSILLPGMDVFWRVVEFLLSLAITSVLFAMIFKILPDVKIIWSDVWVGAAVTSLLFNIGRYLIGLYLGRSSVSSAYGAAGSLVIILLWIYYSAQIFFLGVEFTQVYARRFGVGIIPSPKAARLKESDRVNQGMPHAEVVESVLWGMPVRMGAHPSPVARKPES
jgi:membrane protein